MKATVSQGMSSAVVTTSATASLGDVIAEALGLANVRTVGVNVTLPDFVDLASSQVRFDVAYDRGKDGSPVDYCTITLEHERLRRELADKEAAFEEAGGRGVDLAESIDALRAEVG